LFVEIFSGAGAAAGATFVEPLGCVEPLVVLEPLFEFDCELADCELESKEADEGPDEPRLMTVPAQPASENPTSEIHTAT
jgi:hypothetical protein